MLQKIVLVTKETWQDDLDGNRSQIATLVSHGLKDNSWVSTNLSFLPSQCLIMEPGVWAPSPLSPAFGDEQQKVVVGLEERAYVNTMSSYSAWVCMEMTPWIK